MKLKEIDRTANIAWSPPVGYHPIYLAAGTAAQQLDATFSTTALLEIYDLNLNEPCSDMNLKGSINSDFRFHKIIWGCMESHVSEASRGLIVGGADGGHVLIYDPAKIIIGEDALVFHETKHSGPVRTLDYNKHKDYLLASGGCKSEIYIWDLNNPSSPETVEVKSVLAEDVTSVAWNCKVQHILASTFPSCCVVWDVRKKDPIIKVYDSASQMHCKMVAWHSEVATQLCIASDSDCSPLIQLWDLRFATTPVRNLKYHQKGILSMSWCPQDPDLLLSCAKDSKIVCWNPNSSVEDGEIVYELPAIYSSQWSFDVAWCPRNPAVFASSSCDGHVSVYSLIGGQSYHQCSSKIAEAFPCSDKFSQPHVIAPAQTQVQLKRPPKWLRRPVGANFFFGGKLIGFANEYDSNLIGQTQKLVYVSQVVTDPDILENTEQIWYALKEGTWNSFCENRSKNSTDLKEKMKWDFLEATFSSSPREKMLSILGYDYQKISAEVSEKIIQRDYDVQDTNGQLKNKISMMELNDELESSQKSICKDRELFTIQADSGNFNDLLSRTLLVGNIEAAVELCIQECRWPDAFVLSYKGGQSLMEKTQKLYFCAVKNNSSKLISAVALSDWSNFAMNCDVECWKEALAAILTYTKPEVFASLCEILGNRMEKENDCSYKSYAALCYICAGNLERLADLWIKENKSGMISLQNIVEQIVVLRHSLERLSGAAPVLQNGTATSLLWQFASLVASQGNLMRALIFLDKLKEESCVALQDRIYQALGHNYKWTASEVSQSFNHIEKKSEKPNNVKVPNFLHAHQMTHSKLSHDDQRKRNQQQYMPPGAVLQTHPQPPIVSGSYSFSTSASHPQHFTSNASSVNTLTNMCLPQNPVVSTSMPPTEPSGSVSFGTDLSTGKGSSGHHLSQRYPKNLHDPSVYSDPIQRSNQYLPSYSPAIPAQPEINCFSTAVSQQSVSFHSKDHSGTVSFPTYSNPSCTPATCNSFPTPVPSGSLPQMTTLVPSSHGETHAETGWSDSLIPKQSLPKTTVPPVQQFPSSYGDATTGWNDPPFPNQSLPKTAVPPVHQFPSSYGEIKTGWNDPPWLKPSSSKQPSVCHETLTPITTPLTGSHSTDASQPFPAVPVSDFAGASFMPQHQYQPAEPSRDSSVINAKQDTPEPTKEKGPIPPEHQILKDTFEDLRRQCQQIASNPQAQRKLEDVAKRMENLYDLLRDNSLSSTVTHGLHQIVQSVLQGDCLSALNAHAQIVSSANFSEISSFIPSIKILLQTASQLGVFS